MSADILQRFKSDLDQIDETKIFWKYILSGNPAVVEADDIYEIRQKICEFLKTDFNEVVLVGSAKLGFSIKPDKRYTPFGEESDLDLPSCRETYLKTYGKKRTNTGSLAPTGLNVISSFPI